MALISFKDFAAEVGVSGPAISQAAKTRLANAVFMQGGRPVLDHEIALELWNTGNVARARNREKAGGRPRGRPPGSKNKPRTDAPPSPPVVSVAAPVPAPAAEPRRARRPLVAEAVAAEVMRLPDDAIPDLGQSLERKEHYRAELAKVHALQARKELGSISEMERQAFQLARTVRDAVMSVPARIGASLAAIDDRLQVEELLEAELAVALRSVSDG